VKIINLIVGVSAACGMAMAANAGVVFNNPYDGSGAGDCSWSTTCAAEVGRGDDFAAQEFTLGSGTTITSGGFSELPGYAGYAVTSVNWQILDANGSGGLPGTLVASGTGAVTSYTVGAFGAPEGLFTIGSISLASGTYYLAIQGVSPDFEEYLAEGVAGSGDANTSDGGTTWTSGYYCGGDGDCMPSVAIELFGGSEVPEPAAWALMLIGFGGLGTALRMRRGKRALGSI
jgi:hypothetical protein